MNISISVAATPCAMPQIMFAGDLEARCALLAGLGYDGIDMFSPSAVHGCPRRQSSAGSQRTAGYHAYAWRSGRRLVLNDAGSPNCSSARSTIWNSAPCLGPCRTSVSSGAGTATIRTACPAWRTASPRIVNSRSPSCDVLLEPICRCEIDSMYNGSGHRLSERAENPPISAFLISSMNIEEASVCGAICRADRSCGTFISWTTRAVPAYAGVAGCRGLPWP